MQVLRKNVEDRTVCKGQGHEAGLCLACSSKSREALVPGLRVDEGRRAQRGHGGHMLWGNVVSGAFPRHFLVLLQLFFSPLH